MLSRAARAPADPRDSWRAGATRPGRDGRQRGTAGDAELSDLGDSFQQVTARLAADRTERAGQRALESVVDQLEDAVALFGPDGTLLFSNAAMETALGLPAETTQDPPPDATLQSLLPADHPYRVAVERALAGRASRPAPVQVPGRGERLVLTNVVPGTDGEPIGRAARLAQPGVHQPGGVDAELLAQAERAQPADRRHRARNQEPAQRHDDPSRAAQDGARGSPDALEHVGSLPTRCAGSTRSCRDS